MSIPLYVTVTGWLYQPLESALRPRVALTVGDCESILNAAESTDDAVLPARSVTDPDPMITAEPFVPVVCVKSQEAPPAATHGVDTPEVASATEKPAV